jgi:hypothetical protein
MKMLLSLALLSLTGLGTLSAGVVSISSNGTAADGNETNSLGTPTLAIVGHPGWAQPLPGSDWVSYGETGDPNRPGYFMPANGTVVSFFDRINVVGSVIAGTITVRADDSSSMYINGVKVFDEATQTGNTYTVCSDFVPGCLTTTQITVDITSFLNSGLNVFRFDVAQRASISYGLNYSGTVTSDSAIPEPGTYALIGSALLGLGMFRRRRS